MKSLPLQPRVCGRQRSELEVNVWPWMGINNDRKQAVDDARGSVAFYASASAYESFFEDRGFLAEAQACQAEIKQGVDVQALAGFVHQHSS